MPLIFKNPIKSLKLDRYPVLKHQDLQAWDAADEYLLEYLSQQDLTQKNLMTFNDAFGAITLPLCQFMTTYVTDSYVSKLGLIHNAQLNNIDLENISIINSLELPANKTDVLLIKAPKTLDYLRYFITKIRPYLSQNCQVIVSGMIKNTPKSVWSILEELLGKTNTSLAKKKARLIFVTPENKLLSINFPTVFQQENTDFEIYNHANVFSKKSLDIGTRFLLNNLPKLDNIETIIDLGCGNGIVGLNLAKLYPKADILFVDESYMAVDSARLTIQNNLSNLKQYQFKCTDCLTNIHSNSVDLIVCNPPFHQAHHVGITIALRMFNQAFITLKSNGVFVVVANRHLPYYSHLKRIFGKIVTIASNKKFSIFLMYRSSR